MGLRTAWKAFSAALFDKDLSAKIDDVLAGKSPETVKQEPPRLESPPPAAEPRRSDAITLLSALQRESRLIDLVFEDLTQYADAQVGAAARPCLQQCQKTLQRMLDLKPLVDASEGEMIDVGDSPSPTRYQRVGDGQSPSAKLVHHGWRSASVNLPQWTGSDTDADIVAPAQVEG